MKSKLLHEGAFIPALPLALNENRCWDEFSQRILVNYYVDSGVDGLAVGVHTTQFEIRDFGLYEKILEVASEEIDELRLDRPFLKIAGVSGFTEQAIQESKIAKKFEYDLVLVSLNGLSDVSEIELINHIKAIGDIMPIFGFYLQPSVGGRILSHDFWCKLADLECVKAIKIAPFNRYQTLDVVKAVLKSSRRDEIALYTGNDDNIIADLLTSYSLEIDGVLYKKDIVGGLLGHWAVWTHQAVKLFKKVKKAKETGQDYSKLLEIGTHITDCNAAFFDVQNQFKGSIAGINHVLFLQGLLKGSWCLLSKERLSLGQKEYIEEVYNLYPHLNDDQFVKENLPKWQEKVQSRLG